MNIDQKVGYFLCDGNRFAISFPLKVELKVCLEEDQRKPTMLVKPTSMEEYQEQQCSKEELEEIESLRIGLGKTTMENQGLGSQPLLHFIVSLRVTSPISRWSTQ